jgi:hypothetical protein
MGKNPAIPIQEHSMTHLVLALFGSDDVFGSFGLWAFLSVGAVALFGVFIPLVTFIESRRKEREAFYQAETIRRVAEASNDGAKATVELLREQNRQEKSKKREGMKIGGLINVGVGLGLMVFLHALVHDAPVYLCGMIPGLIGVAMLVYVYFLAAPLE